MALQSSDFYDCYDSYILVKPGLGVQKLKEDSGTAIMLRMADQKWSDISVIFTMILCGPNFCTC